MIHYIDWTASSPLAIAVAEALYYALGIFAGGYVVWRVCRELVASGHAPASVARFAFVFVAIAAPLTYLGYRAGSMMHLPVDRWSLDLFFRAPRLDGSHSFPVTLVLPFALLSTLTLLFRYRYLQVMDTAFLFLPIAHAIGSFGCLLVACCWGETTRLGVPGFQTTVTSPTPLYSIGLNLLIFALLRRIHRVTYRSEGEQRRYEGTVFGGYLVLYGASRLVMETFPHQDLVLWRLGQGQLLTLPLLAAGSCVLWRVRARSHREHAEAHRTMTRLTSLLGIATSYLLLIFVFHHLTIRTHLLPTPFHRADSVADAYARIGFGLPLIVPALLGLFFLRRAGERIRPYLRWPRASPILGVALLVSGLYAFYALVLRSSSAPAPAPGWAYWPPVLILSTVNAVSEELIHRLAVLRLLLVSGFACWGALLVQSVLYSLVHFMIAPSLGLLALVYGLLLGVLMSRTQSVTACILCHLVIDLGVIGGPLLIG